MVSRQRKGQEGAARAMGRAEATGRLGHERDGAPLQTGALPWASGAPLLGSREGRSGAAVHSGLDQNDGAAERPWPGVLPISSTAKIRGHIRATTKVMF